MPEAPFCVGVELQHLLRRIMCVDASRRITISEILQHPWLTAHVLVSSQQPTNPIKRSLTEASTSGTVNMPVSIVQTIAQNALMSGSGQPSNCLQTSAAQRTGRSILLSGEATRAITPVSPKCLQSQVQSHDATFASVKMSSLLRILTPFKFKRPLPPISQGSCTQSCA
jgi:serine/threonine protein kinase